MAIFLSIFIVILVVARSMIADNRSLAYTVGLSKLHLTQASRLPITSLRVIDWYSIAKVSVPYDSEL